MNGNLAIRVPPIGLVVSVSVCDELGIGEEILRAGFRAVWVSEGKYEDRDICFGLWDLLYNFHLFIRNYSRLRSMYTYFHSDLLQFSTSLWIS